MPDQDGRSKYPLEIPMGAYLCAQGGRERCSFDVKVVSFPRYVSTRRLLLSIHDGIVEFGSCFGRGNMCGEGRGQRVYDVEMPW